MILCALDLAKLTADIRNSAIATLHSELVGLVDIRTGDPLAYERLVTVMDRLARSVAQIIAVHEVEPDEPRDDQPDCNATLGLQLSVQR